MIARPLASGDRFFFSGHSLRSLVYHGSSPNPSATFADSISQSIDDEGPKPFDGATPFDLHVSEIDTSKTERETLTTDAYVATLPYGASKTGYYTYGYSSIASGGETISDTLSHVPASDGLLDILPETGLATWTNDAAQSIEIAEADGSTSARTVAANGTYTETDTYPQTSQSSTPPPLVATVVENADGSGTYDTPIFGSSNETLTYSAPAAGTITIQTPRSIEPVTVAQWYALPLYVEHDRDDGAQAIPAACHVPATYGSQANGIEEKFTKADTIFGTLETFDQITYVAGGYAVCTTLSDTTEIFYDYSGAGDAADGGLEFSGGTTPVELETFVSTIGMTSTNVTGAARMHSSRPRLDARGLSVRAGFLAMLERRRAARIRRAQRYLQSAHFRALLVRGYHQ